MLGQKVLIVSVPSMLRSAPRLVRGVPQVVDIAWGKNQIIYLYAPSYIKELDSEGKVDLSAGSVYEMVISAINFTYSSSEGERVSLSLKPKDAYDVVR